MKIIVVTSDKVEAGLTLNYLFEHTALRVDSVFFDTLRARSAPKTGKSTSRPPMVRGARLWMHLRLALKLRRHYLLLFVQRLTGLNRLQVLAVSERLSPLLFRWLCGFPQDEALRGHLLLFNLAEICAARSIPVYETDDINGEPTVAQLRERGPDVIIGLGTRILSPAVLSCSRLGVLNGHSSLLPDYRGSAAEFWQLTDGRNSTGVTIHWMAEKVDQGQICAQRSWPVPRGIDHYGLRLMSLFYRLETWGEVVRQILAGEIPRRPQGAPSTPTFRRPTFEQICDFYCRGRRPTLAPAPQQQSSASS